MRAFQNRITKVCSHCSSKDILQPPFHAEIFNAEQLLMSAKLRRVLSTLLSLFLTYFQKMFLFLLENGYFLRKIYC